MDYRKKVTAALDTQNAIVLAKELLSEAGLNIHQKRETTLQFSSPGYRSTKQNPLRGVSKGELSFSNNSCTLKADLDEIHFLQRFVYYFPAGLILGIGLIMLIVFLNVFSLWIALAASSTAIVVYLPWLFISPYMSSVIKRRTIKALDHLANRLSQIQ